MVASCHTTHSSQDVVTAQQHNKDTITRKSAFEHHDHVIQFRQITQ